MCSLTRAQSVLSVRNQPKVTDNGFAYVFDRCSADETLRFYRCDKRNDNCPARIHVSVETSEIVRRIHDHNHGSDVARIEAAKATLLAVRNAFPQAALLGCLYHLAKNVRLHVGNEGLLARYNNDADFALQVRMIVALAFVPLADVELAFETLEDELPDELQPVLAYFETYYIRRRRNDNVRRQPLFEKAL